MPNHQPNEQKWEYSLSHDAFQFLGQHVPSESLLLPLLFVPLYAPPPPPSTHHLPLIYYQMKVPATGLSESCFFTLTYSACLVQTLQVSVDNHHNHRHPEVSDSFPDHIRLQHLKHKRVTLSVISNEWYTYINT